jgi:hypothetical protein
VLLVQQTTEGSAFCLAAHKAAISGDSPKAVMAKLAQWLMPVIPASQEVDSGSIKVQGQPGG